jgi:hypothetical protein
MSVADLEFRASAFPFVLAYAQCAPALDKEFFCCSASSSSDCQHERKMRPKLQNQQLSNKFYNLFRPSKLLYSYRIM